MKKAMKEMLISTLRQFEARSGVKIVYKIRLKSVNNATYSRSFVIRQPINITIFA